MARSLRFLCFILLPCLLSACLPAAAAPSTPSSTSNWVYSDLRLLDEVDAPLADQDIIAAYTRTSGDSFEIRLDLLDLKAEADLDLYIPIASGPSTTPKELPLHASADFAWNTLLVIPANAEPRAMTAQNEILSAASITVNRDPAMDTIVIRLDRSLVPTGPGALRLQVFTTAPGALDVVDQTPSFLANGIQLVPRAPLLLAFWDTLPAATPAQALRRWDGAHTGPFGKRHGLFRLLQTSAEAGVPVALLDLKTPTSLAALDYLGGMERLRTLQAQGLVILPDVAFGDPQAAAISLEYSRRAALAFGLPASPLLFGPVPAALSGSYPAAFAVLAESDHLAANYGQRLIPLPGPVYPADTNAEAVRQAAIADANGPSPAVVQQLIQAALSGDPSRIVVIGGSLPASPLADSSVAAPFFQYLAAHPWIQTLTAADLLTLPAMPSSSPFSPGCEDLLCSPAAPATLNRYSAQGEPIAPLQFSEWKDETRAQLAALQAGRLTDLAWLAYLGLTPPTNQPALLELRAAYLDQVERLIAAAQWAEHPTDESNCRQGEDGGYCVLADEQQFAWIDLAGARLSLAVWRPNDGEPIQYIAPASQFVTGLSDAMDWHPERGPAADPNEIPGAFADLPLQLDLYQAETKPGEIVLTHPATAATKTFRLTPDGLTFSYTTPDAIYTQIPLIIYHANDRYPGTDAIFPLYLSSPEDKSATPQIEITGASEQTQAYFDSLPWIRSPEDPDRDYPPGHYLPFPLAVIEIHSQGSFQVEFSFKK